MILTITLLVLVVALAYFVWRFSAECIRLRTRYANIIDVDAAIAEAKHQLDGVRRDQEAYEAASVRDRAQRERERQSLLAQDEQQRSTLDKEYAQALATYRELMREISLVQESLEDISFGLYKPHFSFQTPEAYKTALTALRDRERSLIQSGRAAVCPVNWRVGDSEKEGARMVKQNVKLILRAFNGDCEAARADVSWNNITKMEERIGKSCEAMNKLSGVLKVTITPDYFNLKLDELRLTHEFEEKKYQDREEQRRIREQIREEERAQREFDKAQADAEAEEVRYQKVLAKAREEAALATGAALERLTKQIGGFEAKLDEARQKKERAISRAQLTKSGFVYVISNIGSFGEKVYKIGMTRRLEPMERIVELGGASVPFPFDLHAMLYSDNAPELESALHQLFAQRRLNMVNARREFYRGIELDEIESFVKTKGLSAQFIKDAEAREYRETLAKREEIAASAPPPDKFSEPLFHTDTNMN
jgi:hypothetical protein